MTKGVNGQSYGFQEGFMERDHVKETLLRSRQKKRGKYFFLGMKTNFGK